MTDELIHKCGCGNVLQCHKEDGYCSHCSEGVACHSCLRQRAESIGYAGFDSENYYDF